MDDSTRRKKISILYISPLPPPAGGIATWTKKILSLGLPEIGAIYLVNTSIKGKRNIFDPAFFSLAEGLRNINIIISLFYQLISKRPRLVHLSCSLSTIGVFRDLLCASIVKIFRLPLISHYRGNVSDFRGARFCGLSAWALKILTKISLMNIVENQSSFDSILVINKALSTNQLVLMPNFIEDDKFSLVKAYDHEKGRRFQAIFAGGITYAKGCKDIIELAKWNHNVDFHLYGKLHDDMKMYFQSYPANIFLHGNVTPDCLQEAMLRSDFLLFPSHTEGFPLSILEAMTFGLPVIASRVGAIPEMIDHEKGGYLVDKKDVLGLHEAIKQFIEDPSKLRRMGEYNREKSYQQYRYTVVSKKLSRMYYDILEEAYPCVV